MRHLVLLLCLVVAKLCKVKNKIEDNQLRFDSIFTIVPCVSVHLGKIMLITNTCQDVGPGTAGSVLFHDMFVHKSGLGRAQGNPNEALTLQDPKGPKTHIRGHRVLKPFSLAVSR